MQKLGYIRYDSVSEKSITFLTGFFYNFTRNTISLIRKRRILLFKTIKDEMYSTINCEIPLSNSALGAHILYMCFTFRIYMSNNVNRRKSCRAIHVPIFPTGTKNIRKVSHRIFTAFTNTLYMFLWF